MAALEGWRAVANHAAASLAVVVGVGSLCLFGVFLWTSGLNLFNWEMQWQFALLWDAGLSLAFFLLHSGMVRRPYREWLSRRVPARWHGVLYTIASGVALVAVVLFWQPSHVPVVIVYGPARWVIRAVALSTLLGFAWGARSVGAFDLLGTNELLGRDQPQGSVLVVRGAYEWVRHPFYLCSVVAIWATPVLTLDRLLFNALWTVWIVIGAHLEERDLIAQFGDAYRDYQRRVRMLIPGWHRAGQEKTPA